ADLATSGKTNEDTTLAGFDFTLGSIVQAFETLLRYVGTDWFEQYSLSHDEKTTPKGKSHYSHLYHPPAHPLVKWYRLFPSWRAECERTGQVFLPQDIRNLTVLGQSLEIIHYDKKFNTLISRLKQSNDFYATAWEIEVAANYVAHRFDVQFIEEQQTPTPDL